MIILLLLFYYCSVTVLKMRLKSFVELSKTKRKKLSQVKLVKLPEINLLSKHKQYQDRVLLYQNMTINKQILHKESSAITEFCQILDLDINYSLSQSICSYCTSSFNTSMLCQNDVTESKKRSIICFKIHQSINELARLTSKLTFVELEMEKIEKRVIYAYQNSNAAKEFM